MDISEINTNVYTVQEKCGAANIRGMIATRDIKKDEIIINAECPIACSLHLQGNAPTDQQILQNFESFFQYKFNDTILAYISKDDQTLCSICNLVQSTIKNYNDKIQYFINDYARSKSLSIECKTFCDTEMKRTLHSIFESNVFELGTQLAPCDKYGLVLYDKIRLFNHACIPNCCTYNDTIRGYVVSIKDIKKGEELTISYIGPIQTDYNECHKIIKEKFGFICKCKYCTDNQDIVTNYVRTVKGTKLYWTQIYNELIYVNSTLPEMVDTSFFGNRIDKERSRKIVNDIYTKITSLFQKQSKIVQVVKKVDKLSATEIVLGEACIIFSPLLKFVYKAFFCISVDAMPILYSTIQLICMFYDYYHKLNLGSAYIMISIKALLFFSANFASIEDPKEYKNNLHLLYTDYHSELIKLYGKENAEAFCKFEQEICRMQVELYEMYEYTTNK